ncbi:hypothetical protein ACO3UB_04910 [Methanocaldococcus sp. 16A]
MRTLKSLICIFFLLMIFNVGYSIINYIPDEYVYDIQPKDIEGFAYLQYDFTLEGELTNDYPYSVFVTLPSSDTNYDVYKICLGREDEIDQKIRLYNYEYYMWVNYDVYPCELWIITNPQTLDKISYKLPLDIPPSATRVTYKYPSVNITLSPNITGEGNFTYKLYEDIGNWNVKFPNSNATLNGVKGFWLPPYTTVKVKIVGSLKTYIGNSYDNKNFEIYGPAVVNEIRVLDPKKIFSCAIENGININYLKLYVRGKIEKGNTDTISIVIPAPLIIENYNSFSKINYDEYNADIWIDSYEKWVNNLEKLSNSNENEYYVEAEDTSYISGALSSDDPLIPKFGWDVEDTKSLFTKFDVPAIEYTTSSDEPIEFAYVIYWNK